VKPVRQQKKKLANGTTKKRVASDVCHLQFRIGPRLEQYCCSTLNNLSIGQPEMAVLTFYRIHHRSLQRDIRPDDICAKPPPISCLPSRIDQQLTTGLRNSFFGLDQPNCTKIKPRPTQKSGILTKAASAQVGKITIRPSKTSLPYPPIFLCVEVS
jgi:hypothetical protein